MKMVLEVLLIVITLLVLIISSYTDIKTREVPDWISYGLVFSALGIRTIYSVSLGWNILISGLIGFLVCFLLAMLFYYTNQWGGGDSKLLMGMGAVIGITYPFNESSLQLSLFFIALLFLGAIYGLLWMSYMAVKKRNVFRKEFKESLNEYKKINFVTGIISLLFVGITFVYTFAWPMIIFPAGMFYLFIFVTTVEKSCFFKKIKIDDLTEGDWLAESITLSEGKVLRKKRALEKKDLIDLKQVKNLKEVLIKEGIPFVPSFLFAYLMILFGGVVWNWLFKMLF